MYSDSGRCVLSRICAFNCCSTRNDYSYGQFAYINSFIKNNVNDSSITHTLKKEGAYPCEAMRLQYGNILCTSVNLTNNECYWCPALLCRSSSCISYNSIVNNTANPGYGCIYLSSSSSSHCIDTCNILNNYQDLDHDGIIVTFANLFIKDSCILRNNKIVFYTNNFFF